MSEQLNKKRTMFNNEYNQQIGNDLPFEGRQSIIGQAKQNIFEFPIFTVNTISMEFATAITSLLEQVYASFLQMAISTKPLVTSDQLRRGKQFSHFKTDTNQYLEYTEDMTYVHDACHNKIITESGMIYEYDMITYDDEIGRIFNEYLEHEPLSEFYHIIQEEDIEEEEVDDSVNISTANKIKEQDKKLYKYNRELEKTVDKAKADLIKNKIMAAQNIKNMINKEDLEKSKFAATQSKDTEKNYPEIAIANETETKAYLQGILNDLPEGHPERYSIQRQMDNVDRKIEQLIINRDMMRNNAIDVSNSVEQKYERELRERNADEIARRKEMREMDAYQNKELRERMVKSSEMIKDQDVTKLNTMKPLMMVVRLRRDEGSYSEPYEFVIGVKCRIRIIPSEILPEVAEYPMKEMNKISRKVRWKAGELKFFKDIVFKIPQRKQTAIDSKDPKRKWFRRLYELAHAKGDSMSTSVMTTANNKMNKLFNMTSFDGGVIPNASIVITKSDVDVVKSKTNIDLLNATEAVAFCKELFLISFIVVDVDAESMRVLLPDLHNDFEVHSLASVNKQLATLDTAGVKTREMFKLL